jgi:hypothetical protein
MVIYSLCYRNEGASSSSAGDTNHYIIIRKLPHCIFNIFPTVRNSNILTQGFSFIWLPTQGMTYPGL